MFIGSSSASLPNPQFLIHISLESLFYVLYEFTVILVSKFFFDLFVKYGRISITVFPVCPQQCLWRLTQYQLHIRYPKQPKLWILCYFWYLLDKTKPSFINSFSALYYKTMFLGFQPPLSTLCFLMSAVCDFCIN